MDTVRTYFDTVAHQWDTLREGYFTEAVRQAALDKAYLRPEMGVADVGCGTGFMSEALAPRVAHVHAVDRSPEMLKVAQRNLSRFDNITYHLAGGTGLPLAAGSMDTVLANMVLHHMIDPAGAIAEMAASLRPGGRLVLTDLDVHEHEWLRQEMADVQLGFDRDDLRRWFREAGLVNVFVTCAGQDCCATSTQGAEAKVTIFVAVGTRARDGVKEGVKASYTEAVASACCQPAESSCCHTVADYSAEEWAQLPAEATGVAFGCGNPVALASLRPGDVVLDIGSGGGIDVFYAARQVYPGGRAIGVDMTPAMLERARATAEKLGFVNVEFRQGEAEALPAPDRGVDVILSNCVINLSPDKGQVFREAFRVLRPGGRLSVSDIVTSAGLPEAVRSDPRQWASCVGGALPEGEYLDLLREAGFGALSTSQGGVYAQQDGLKVYSLYVTAYKPPLPADAAATEPPPAASECG